MLKIFVINPGNTSTKLAIFSDDKEVVSDNIQHPIEQLKDFDTIYDQLDFRMKCINGFLEEHTVDISTLSAVVGRGGLVRPIPCGTYLVNDLMINDLKEGKEGHHASNLGPALAKEIADIAEIPAYIVDPITVDEMEGVAKITGFPEITRQSRLHTLNHKAVGRKAATTLGSQYEEMNFVICHLGTGISIAAHKQGKIVDMCDARGEGPMSGDRAGGINSFLMMEFALSCQLTHDELVKKIYSQSGIVGHLGTKDIREVEQRIQNGDEHAKLVLDAMIYQCAKEIGAQSAAISGKVDRIILTGGMTYSAYITKKLSAMVEFIAPVMVFPGEEEMEALALGALRVLMGEEEAKQYN
ncbi:MAG: butyrate kinase [Sedimentibacter sp.]